MLLSSRSRLACGTKSTSNFRESPKSKISYGQLSKFVVKLLFLHAGRIKLTPAICFFFHFSAFCSYFLSSSICWPRKSSAVCGVSTLPQRCAYVSSSGEGKWRAKRAEIGRKWVNRGTSAWAAWILRVAYMGISALVNGMKRTMSVHSLSHLLFRCKRRMVTQIHRERQRKRKREKERERKREKELLVRKVSAENRGYPPLQLNCNSLSTADEKVERKIY